MATGVMTGVSIIIPTYNRAGKVVRALASALYQTFKNFEIIVVDDGSTDETPDNLSKLHGHIVHITHPANRGVSAARNTGIRAARYPSIAFLDSDDYWFAGKLEAQVAFFHRNPEAVACQTEEIWIRNGRRVNPRRKHLKPSGDILIPSLKLCVVSPSAVMIKRSLLHEVGLFDEDLPACEDYDLWLRIACRYPVHLINRPFLVKEGGNPDQLSAKYKGMDRFRIKALIKLIKGHPLNEAQLEATLKELSEKCRIYGHGCLRRGKKEEAEYYLGLPERDLPASTPSRIPERPYPLDNILT
ncbi:MAG: glycosyltransferase family A protein [Pseudomonadota bacterium]